MEKFLKISKIISVFSKYFIVYSLCFLAATILLGLRFTIEIYKGFF